MSDIEVLTENRKDDTQPTENCALNIDITPSNIESPSMDDCAKEGTENAANISIGDATDSPDKKEATEQSSKASIEIAMPVEKEPHSESIAKNNDEVAPQTDGTGSGDTVSIPKPLENNSLPTSNESAIENQGNNVNCNTIIRDNAPLTKPNTNSTPPQATEAKQLSSNIMTLGASELVISELKQALQKTADERDSYKRKLETTEKKLASLQASYDDLMKGGNDENALKQMVEQLRGKLIQTSLQLDDRVRLANNQEKQISALSNQVASLKEVETLTRSLLQIRNMEVKHLQAEVDDMEARITEERERYNSMINKMDAAVQLNADLKKEYETQLGLFRDLREKYEQKVTLLSEEKRALENAQPPVIQ